VIARAIEISAPLLDQRRQALEVDVATDGLCVAGDAARLAQVFANLLTNAAKYSDPGGRITVKAQRVADRVRVSVRDEGIGIESGLLEQVFSLFHQEGRGLDRAQGGLGLGLAIVRNLVLMHEGTVEALSDGPGKGSTFVVELPVCASDEGILDEHGTAPRVATAEERHHILLVDDNIDARDTLAFAFGALGYKITTASDAFEALDRTDASQPDVAVLDIGLPGIDGYQLAARLRQRNGPGLRLIAVTGYGQPEDKARAVAAGFDAHLIKPVELSELVATIESLASPRHPAG
jgi:CheY-like chemotaxis protein/anti-sigma regulatory factor (Ser/Thr protein kinase)